MAGIEAFTLPPHLREVFRVLDELSALNPEGEEPMVGLGYWLYEALAAWQAHYNAQSPV